MRIATWNLRKAKGKANLCAAHMQEHLRADVYLLQEVIEPEHHLLPHLNERGHMTWESKPQNKNLEGCAIYSPTFHIEPLDMGRFQGWLNAGKISTKYGELCLVSMHAPTTTKVLKGFRLRERNSCASWLTEQVLPFLKRQTSSFENVVVGGDTNCARATGRLGRRFKEAHLEFSRKYGFTEILWEMNDKRELPTWRRSEAKGWSMCNDHLFARGPIANSLSACTVMYEPNPPSDHAPVIAEFK